VTDKQRIEVRRFQPKRYRELITDRGTKTVPVSPQTSLSEPTLVPALDSTASEKALRMEIQTKDPNIRIIWFSQPNTKPESRSSKVFRRFLS
jgi:hypothetical protein